MIEILKLKPFLNYPLIHMYFIGNNLLSVIFTKLENGFKGFVKTIV